MQAVRKIYAVWVYVKDARKSKTFYEQVLGVPPVFQDNGWVEFTMGGTTFAILERPKAKSEFKPAKTRIMFQVEDVTKKEDELKTLGVKVVNRMNEPYGTIITFEDLDGNWLELLEPKAYKPGV